ncbi:unnamed protein product [Blepharisma stoltei]|uniref:TmcB/TmcC TPR repeats domain-containing protein n=1 Tax=Blepharisma stoltei TaxID=1481888 RepID=A0AAU9J9U3_9CILI|nr:unnamed protein product [Blepharisma stoltei]
MYASSNFNLFENRDMLEVNVSQGFFKPWELFLFEIFEKIFHLKYNEKVKFRQQIITEIFTNTLMSLQMISLAWYATMDISEWDYYYGFWKLVGYLNFVSFCDSLQIIELCLYLQIFLIGFCMANFLLILIYRIFKKIYHPTAYFILRKVAEFLSTIFYIPCTLTLSLLFKYSILDYPLIEEFSGKHDAVKINLGPAGAFLSLILMGFLYLMALIYTLFSADIRHFYVTKNFVSKSNSTADLYLVSFITAECWLFVLFGYNSTLYYQTALACFSIGIFLSIFYSLPYYNPLENGIKAFNILSLAIASIIFLFGRMIDNSLIIILLNIFLQPLLCYFTIRGAKINFFHLKLKGGIPKNQYDFERISRHILCQRKQDNPSQVIDYFTKCSKDKNFKKDRLFVVWEVNFCLYIMEDERLARIKLIQILSELPSAEGMVQSWRAVKHVDEISSDLFTDVIYLSYLTDLYRVKRQDEELCYSLLDLWSEISSKSPRFFKLHHLVIMISDYISDIKKVYDVLVTKHKHAQIFDQYISFLENILGDSDYANIINSRKIGLQNAANSRGGDENLLNPYSDKNGIFLISVNQESFGLISYINEKAAQILRVSTTDVIGAPFYQFVPYPYSIGHDWFLKEYFQNCSRPEIIKRNWMFLQNQMGYLVECKFIIRITALSNCAYILVSIKSRDTTRQIAMLSSDGIIYNYSVLFPHYIGAGNQNIRWMHLTSFMPRMYISEMRVCEPYIINLGGQELAFAHRTIQLRTALIHVLVVINDDKEIQLWKERRDTDQIEYFGTGDITDEEIRIHESMNFSISRISKLGKVKFQDLQDQENRMESPNHSEADSGAQFLDDTLNAMSDLVDEGKAESLFEKQAQNTSSVIIQKLVDDTTKYFKTFEIILFFSIIATIGMSIGVLIYTYRDVQHTSEITIFTHLGELWYRFSHMGDTTRTLWFETNYGVLNVTREFLSFNDTINTLIFIKNELLNDLSEWTYCSASSIVTDSKIGIWNFDGPPHIDNYNLYDTVQLLISAGQTLMAKIERKVSIIDEAQFIIINCLGTAYNAVTNTIKDLGNCEESRVKENGTKITLLLFFGILAVGCFHAILIYYIYLINRKYNAFWSFVQQISSLSYIDLRMACVDRLSNVHGIEYDLIENSVRIRSQKDKAAKIHTKIYIKLILHLSIFFLIVLFYFLFQKFYLYDKCENLMKNRPYLIENFSYRRATLSMLSLFSRDTNTQEYKKWFPLSYDFTNSWSEYKQASEILKKKGLEARISKFKILMSDKLKKRVFEGIDTYNMKLRLGDLAATNLVYFDAVYIAAAAQQMNTVNDIWNFVDSIYQLQVEMGIDYQMASEDSKDAINLQLSYIVYTTIMFSIVLISLYVFYYFPLLRHEKIVLKKLQIMTQIIPCTNNHLKDLTI